MTFDAYLQTMLRFIKPEASQEDWLTQTNKGEEFLRFVAIKFQSFNAKELVSPMLSYPEFVVAVTGNNRPAEATRLFELFWKEHADLKFPFGDWKPGQPFPAYFCTSLKLNLYEPWNNERKAKNKTHRGKKTS